jgi:putative endonuclease
MMSSASGTLYIGSTSEFERRVWQHKNGIYDGFSKEHGCTRLVYYEKYDNPMRSSARERQLKGWRREKKVWVIERLNPRWIDLAATWGLPLLMPGESIEDAEQRLGEMIKLGALIGPAEKPETAEVNQRSRGPSTRAKNA